MTKTREEAIAEVSKCILQDRNHQYGDPEDNFAATAKIWEVILGHPVESWQVAACMIGVKLARIAHDPTVDDSWIDAAGYALCGVEVAPDVREVKV